MIIDNLIVNALKKEFQQKLLNGRIEKIYQPDKDSFLLNIWDRKKSSKLLICLNPNTYRTCITVKKYNIPKQYSPLCLNLKKNIESGYITAVEQLNFDRILVFKIESVDNVKDKVNFSLIIELTGKYSNLILTDADNKVISCYKTVEEHQNEERQIIAGHPYQPITNKANKTELMQPDRENFAKLFSACPELPARKFLVNNFLGISSHTAMLLLKNNLSADKKLKDFSQPETELLFKILADFAEKIKNDSLNLHFEKEAGGTNLDFYLGQEAPEHGVSAVIDSYFSDLADLNSFTLLRAELKKLCDKLLAKTRENILKLEEARQSSINSEIYKQYGELLLANIYRLPEKTALASLENFYNENENINIELDENLTISENAQKFFKIYNKAKNTLLVSGKRLTEFQQELEYLEQVDISLNLAESSEDLKEIEAELENGNYVNKKKLKTKKTSSTEKFNLLSVKSADGFEILIGKNNSQNDYLTTKLASDHDIWLHTRLIPGSHVIIRTENGQKHVPETTILEAAGLAAKYSKARYSGNVCVIYTKIKHVKKPPRSKPGFVIYANEKAVYVTPPL